MIRVCSFTFAQMYQALLQHDQTQDGVLFAGVTTTGIFCRPSCPAKKPKPEHVCFFFTIQEAQQAGFRPCQRCHPLELLEKKPDWVKPLLQLLEENQEQRVTEKVLDQMGFCSKQVRRYFRKHYGMTFQAYQRAYRLGVARKELSQGKDLLQTGFNSGFESVSGFRDAFFRLFGKPPGQVTKSVSFASALVAKWFDTPLGSMVGLTTEQGICFLAFAQSAHTLSSIERLQKQMGVAVFPGHHHYLEQLEMELAAYFSGAKTQFQVPLHFVGTSFQKQVWSDLQKIPFGQTKSYAQLSEEVELPQASRAIGQASARNPIALLVPCHRIIRKDGTFCGYAGGLWRKQWLLHHEHMAFSKR